MAPDEFDAGDFRRALGSFTTGVTIITARSAEGEPVGLTANSFNSVSLDPPMVLWSLAKKAYSLPIFRESRHWAVHILSSEQADLSTLFARAGENKFSGLDTEEGVGGLPMLKACTARFQCETAFQYDGGDHVIFVGKVLSFKKNDVAPLVFHGGRYAHATPRDNHGEPREPALAGSFNENFLGYLLGRSHFLFYSRIRPLLEKHRLADEEFYVLSTLTLRNHLTSEQLDAGMAGILDERSTTALDSLINRGYVEKHTDAQTKSPAYALTQTGSKCALEVISAAKALEEQVTQGMGYEDAAAMKSLLKRLLDNIDVDARALWED